LATLGQEFIGNYRLLNVVKTGQTSQVWAVIDDRSRERFAIKTLLNDFRKDREQASYMKQEYTVAKGLDSPYVIHIYEYGVDRGTPFLVMELFPAGNMKELILRSREQTMYLIPKIIENAALGLSYFHQQGWIHRDIKPDNFMVDGEGTVKLIDFALAQKPKTGLAKFFGGKTKKIQGTRSYMSPEQIRGLPLDFRSDIYSFGCAIHELVSGKLPFAAPSANELLQKHIGTPPPALEGIDPNVTKDFGLLVRSCMAKKPENRPESMDTFLSAFKQLKVFKVMPKPPQQPQQN
jgi:serine/threonine protein kinase